MVLSGREGTAQSVGVKVSPNHNHPASVYEPVEPRMLHPSRGKIHAEPFARTLDQGLGPHNIAVSPTYHLLKASHDLVQARSSRKTHGERLEMRQV